MDDREQRQTIGAAYLSLLKLPPIERARIQMALCELRDYIAEELGCEPEDVQNLFEARARK